MANSNEVKEEYASSLRDLTFNSKPLISVLTILAEENIQHAKDIVGVIEQHLTRVRTEVKLPVLYLIDCIIKNVGREYTSLFCQNIVSTFCSVFEQVDEKTRSEMFKLRQTWNDVLPQKKLFALDVQIQQLDPAWPVTAPPPNNSIHLNPKFLKNTPAVVTKATTGNIVPSSNVSPVDPDTLSMQQKLINKQKELLELQQRKLELELLQTQVRLQEQLKGKTSSSDVKVMSHHQNKDHLTHTQNLLLKPGVTKEMSANESFRSTTASHLRNRADSQKVSTNKNKLQQGSGQIMAIGLTSTHRTIKDPRLVRLQEKQHQEHQQHYQQGGQVFSSENVNANVHLESKSKTTSPQVIHSENKVITNNKMSVRDSRTEPRSVSNNKSFDQGKSKTSLHLSSFPLKSNNPKSIINSKKSTKSNNSKTSSISASNFSSSSVDSPGKNKNGFHTKSRSPIKSSFKSKNKNSCVVVPEKDKLSEKGDNSNNSSPRLNKDIEQRTPTPVVGTSQVTDNIVNKDKKSEKLSFTSIKSEQIKKSSSKNDDTSSTRELVVSTKNRRNYMRRNREALENPETPHDVDLRVSSPSEKHLQLPEESSDDRSDSINYTPMDVDLRQLSSIVGNKRPSTEIADSSSTKKAKSELFDVLFGSEDTDLRQLPPVLSPTTSERPKTPPPPIISKIKERSPQLILNDEKESPIKTHLDILRAKLACATHRETFESKRILLAEQENSKMHEDTDMRKLSLLDQVDKIIISPADEQCIKTGNMTKAQEAALMNKIIAQIETQKLREAKRKESEILNTLQPISDDELDLGEFSESDNDESIGNSRFNHGDKDDRLNSMIVSFNPSEESYSSIQSKTLEPREIRRNVAWRGKRVRGGWENYSSGMGGMSRSAFRGKQEPWLRTLNPSHGGSPWRPMKTGFLKSLYHDDSNLENINARSNSRNSPNAGSNEETSENIVFSQSSQDSVKTINIDGIPRVIRFYDETAVIFMNWDDPREISFQNGTRRVTFNENETYILSFNEPYRDVLITGSPHKIRLGGPTKEIFIDSKGYECYFGSSGITADIDSKLVHIKLDGPPPQVKIGTIKREDLVLGKINLIIDAKIIVPIYLDGKVQQIEVDGKLHKLKFINSFKKVKIDDIVYPVEFGGLPKPVMLSETKRFVRFSVLPKGIIPGRVVVKDMENIDFNDFSSKLKDENDDFLNTRTKSTDTVSKPNINDERKTLSLQVEEDSDKNSNEPQILQHFINQQSYNNLDFLSNVMASSIPSSANVSSYQIEETNENYVISDVTNCSIASQNPPLLNINELFQKLVATGIVTTVSSEIKSDTSTASATTKSHHSANKSFTYLAASKPVHFDKPDTLKMRQSSLIQALYVGMQCSSCGMRFPPEFSIHYSQHLDWHFRQNRKGKKNIRKATSRKWYYSLSDWKNFEEIEDIDEREKSYFENQCFVESNGNEEDEDIEIPSVSANQNAQDACCEVCKERFEQFYNEEKEEWHLRMAVRVDGKTYHPLCHEDYLASLADLTISDTIKLNDSQIEEENKEKIPGLEVVDEPVLLDDDEPELVDENSSTASIKNEKVEQKLNNDNDTTEKQDGDDDDVIINEVVPEKIVVEDDDEDLPLIEPKTKSETKEEFIDDGFIDVENGLLQIKSGCEVKIKTEPIDPDELQEEVEIEGTKSSNSQDKFEFKPSIDGNVEYNSTSIPTASTSVGGRIKINISKPIINTTGAKESKESGFDEKLKLLGSVHKIIIDPSQPLPPGEEPVQLNVKPALKGLYLKKLPTIKKGTELTGLCSIM